MLCGFFFFFLSVFWFVLHSGHLPTAVKNRKRSFVQTVQYMLSSIHFIIRQLQLSKSPRVPFLFCYLVLQNLLFQDNYRFLFSLRHSSLYASCAPLFLDSSSVALLCFFFLNIHILSALVMMFWCSSHCLTEQAVLVCVCVCVPVCVCAPVLAGAETLQGQTVNHGPWRSCSSRWTCNAV